LTPVLLKVDYQQAPIQIQNPTPSFSFALDAAGSRGVVSKGFTLVVKELAADGTLASTVWDTGAVTGNQTTFIKYPSDAPALKSNTDYTWSVTLAGSSAAVSSTFSTALMSMDDWASSKWILASSGQAAQMRKEFTLPAGKITRARAFFAMPGYGTMKINGKSVDGTAGTRTWSQYDKRTIYGVYDITEHLLAGSNAVGVYAGQGWYGHWGYGPPAIRVLITATVDGKTVTVGSDTTWTMSAGPVQTKTTNTTAKCTTPALRPLAGPALASSPAASPGPLSPSAPAPPASNSTTRASTPWPSPRST
jgi:alpha-L-rhamnosidase